MKLRSAVGREIYHRKQEKAFHFWASVYPERKKEYEYHRELGDFWRMVVKTGVYEVMPEDPELIEEIYMSTPELRRCVQENDVEGFKKLFVEVK
jgi:hypothetical protein